MKTEKKGTFLSIFSTSKGKKEKAGKEAEQGHEDGKKVKPGKKDEKVKPDKKDEKVKPDKKDEKVKPGKKEKANKKEEKEKKLQPCSKDSNQHVVPQLEPISHLIPLRGYGPNSCGKLPFDYIPYSVPSDLQEYMFTQSTLPRHEQPKPGTKMAQLLKMSILPPPVNMTQSIIKHTNKSSRRPSGQVICSIIL